MSILKPQVNGKQFTQDSEGCRLTIYYCSSGEPTIGIGHNLNRPIPQRVADLLFEYDYAEAESDAKFFLREIWHTLDRVRRDAVIDMAFNMGLPRLSGFVKFRAALKRGDFQAAADEVLDSHYAREHERTGSRRALIISNAIRSGTWGE